MSTAKDFIQEGMDRTPRLGTGLYRDTTGALRILLTTATEQLTFEKSVGSKPERKPVALNGRFFAQDFSQGTVGLEMIVLSAPPNQMALEEALNQLINAARPHLIEEGRLIGLAEGQTKGYRRGFGHGNIRGRNEGRKEAWQKAKEIGFEAALPAALHGLQVLQMADPRTMLQAIRSIAPGFHLGYLPMDEAPQDPEDFEDMLDPILPSASMAEEDLVAIGDAQRETVAPVLASDLEAETPPAATEQTAYDDIPIPPILERQRRKQRP